MELLLLVPILLTAGVVSSEQPDLKKAYAQFSAELYTELSKRQSGSFVLCPPSIQTGLGLIYSGAKGDSAKQISTSLHLPNEPKEFQVVLHDISKTLKSPQNGDYTLNSANKVYINHNFKISGQYKDTLTNVYDADIDTIDFSKKAEAAAEINKWIEDKTHNKIKNMVKEDQLNDVQAALVNAMYFQGKWIREFNQQLTKPAPFYVNENTEKDVETMNMAGHYNYYESSELRAQFLELPYKGEGITMTFVLPIDRYGLSALESHINEVLLTPKFKKEQVIMAIPKFKIDTSTSLVQILTKLGIKNIFTNNADLSGMTEDKFPLKIGEALQKAVIEVDEKGTVATAAFVGFAVPFSANFEPPPTYNFIANHPFIYYIKVQDIVMFIGRCTSP